MKIFCTLTKIPVRAARTPRDRVRGTVRHLLRESTHARVEADARIGSYAHNRLTAFMESHGFKVTRKYLGMQTAWRAEFSCGEGGRVIGLQSEMDALPNIGHACGHNLIAISGVAVAIGLKAALQKHAVSGKIVLLGTPGKTMADGQERGAEAYLLWLCLQPKSTVVERFNCSVRERTRT